MTRAQKARNIYKELKAKSLDVAKVWVEYTHTYTVGRTVVRTVKYAVMAGLNNGNVNAGVGDTLEEATAALITRIKRDPYNSQSSSIPGSF